ncbi:Uncharacterised protein [Sphingobacterium spiritivorum]|uniref:Uncharacterized protein n=1 Tax=Sphingobacterium spiritivorum TaxID=258 RepID=A0A380CP74_SPHSI|nr:hypothetical protein [Sphingobacterium spiritivorum]SUJ24039.1 Uncharacterised protein [Sphingobacterium spiritivorum]
MKNLIKTVAVVLFIAITSSSFASGIYNPGKNYSADAVISNYIETTTMGNPENVENLFTDNFFQTVSTPAKVITHSKKTLYRLCKKPERICTELPDKSYHYRTQRQLRNC